MTGIVIPDGGTIGSASDTDAISIASSGKPTFSQGIANTGTIDGGAIGSAVTMSANQACVKTALNASGSPEIFAVRAWANINGSSSPSIRADGGFSTVGVSGGLFTLNFSTDMGSTDYATLLSARRESGNASSNNTVVVEKANTYTSGSFKVFCFDTANSTLYPNSIYVAVIK